MGRLPERPVLAADYCEPTKIVGIKRRAVEMKEQRRRLVCVILPADRNKRAGDCRSPKWCFASYNSNRKITLRMTTFDQNKYTK